LRGFMGSAPLVPSLQRAGGIMPWPPHALGLAGIVASVGLAALIAFHPASHADMEPARASNAVPAAQPAVTWEPTVVTTPGLPVQCADGAWTRTSVRGGCARHGGIGY
ncbi:MAG TPA: hypothetical protein VHS09_16740, partial [Polyangiaceae bacterium]|nr:hypothetical protein [Polyangiaceae bacterium]